MPETEEKIELEEEFAQKRSHSRLIWLCLTILFAWIAVAACAFWIYQRHNRIAADETYRQLSESTETDSIAQPIASAPDPSEESAPIVYHDSDAEAEAARLREKPEFDFFKSYGVEIPEKQLDWDELHEINPDIYAWITVPGTTVDYPVLQHPSNNSYYLMHNLDGSYGYPGVIYTENYNRKDFTDPNTVLYGHNLIDKTMFSSLHNFENPDMVSEPHFIFIFMEGQEEPYVYEIFAAYEYPSIHLLLNFDLSNEYVHEQYIKDIFQMKKMGYGVANIRDNIDVNTSKKLITLSTCTSDHDASERFLVVGFMINLQG